jgi:serine protease SohB
MSQIETHLLPVDKKIYISYTFDNLNETESKSTFSKISHNEQNVFDDLESFVHIMLDTFNPNDVKILLKISSPGGYAYQFERAYTHLMLLRNAGYNITALIDDMCASGGYMLASACNKIICSEYAQIGSVGVVGSFYNYHDLITKIGIVEKTLTTGAYKRTFPSGEPLEQQHIEKTQETIIETLDIFKSMVQKGRGLTDAEMEDILSARCWYGIKALEKKLVDQICPSAEYYNQIIANNIIFIVKRKNKKEYGSIIGSILNRSLGSVSESITESISIIFSDIFKQHKQHKQTSNLKIEDTNYLDKIV